MQKITLRSVSKYLYDQLTGNFIGFVIGASATGIVSQFFETRSVRNLWGLTAKKAVIDKETFQNLEWVISILIGFIAFEIVTKVIKARVDVAFPKYRYLAYRWIVRENIRDKVQTSREMVTEKSNSLFMRLQDGARQILNRFSSR